MKNSLKGALLSGLVFPGAGQFWLGRRITGTTLALATVAALAAVVSKTIQQAYLMLERAESEGTTVDLVAVAKSAQAASSQDPAIKLAWLVLLACWVIGIIDAYLAGGTKDRAQGRRE